MKKVFLIFFILPTLLFAQQNIPLNRAWSMNYEKEKNTTEQKFQKNDTSIVNNVAFVKSKCVFKGQSCFKPYILPIQYTIKDTTKSWLYRKLKKESFVIVNDTTDKFRLTIDPLFNFELGTDLADTSHEKLYKNTRGVLVRGVIGSKFCFETSFYENQATYAKYIDNYIAATNNLFPQTANYDYAVIPGQGRSKKFNKNGYDFAMASGYISYSPNKVFNFQLGHGKNFVGDGYRSLLLSDNAFNYPYARITSTYKNIQYTNLYTSFMNLTTGGVKTPANTEHLFQKKIGSFQLLSVNFFHRIQLGFFQGMIWEAADSSNRQHPNFNTFNPVIGINALSYGMHYKNNVLLGATLKATISRSISLYSQFMLDDVVSKSGGAIRKKYGYQIGFNYFDLFNIKNLHLQFEYNSVRPYAYAASDPQQSYTHYNQSLAHPLGANFNEMVGFLNYRLKDFFIELKLNYSVKGSDSSAYNYGSNIFKSDNIFPITQNLSSIPMGQGTKTTIMYQDIHMGYLVNPSTNFNIIVGVSNRIETTEKLTSKTQFVYFGIRTSLSNFYFDF